MSNTNQYKAKVDLYNDLFVATARTTGGIRAMRAAIQSVSHLDHETRSSLIATVAELLQIEDRILRLAADIKKTAMSSE